MAQWLWISILDPSFTTIWYKPTIACSWCVVEGDCSLEEIKAIALCYTELDDMLNFEDKFDAINFLINHYNQDIKKVSSKTNISSQEISALLNYKDTIEKIKKDINQIASLDNNLFLKKASQIKPKEMDDLSNFLNKLI